MTTRGGVQDRTRRPRIEVLLEEGIRWPGPLTREGRERVLLYVAVSGVLVQAFDTLVRAVT